MKKINATFYNSITFEYIGTVLLCLNIWAHKNIPIMTLLINIQNVEEVWSQASHPLFLYGSVSKFLQGLHQILQNWDYYTHTHASLYPLIAWLTIEEKFSKEALGLPALHLKFKFWSTSLLPVSRLSNLSDFVDIFWKAMQVIPMKLDGLIIKASRATLRETYQNKEEGLRHCFRNLRQLVV